MKIIVIGGGAAGFFAAISAKEHHSTAEVTILEKSKNILAKVRISGGGRCNVTNGCKTIKELTEGYPRGAKKLKKAFRVFDNQSTWKWFEERGVALKTESDNRVFPISDSSQSIIDCLTSETNRLGIEVRLQTCVVAIKTTAEGFQLELSKDKGTIAADKVIIASGGSPKRAGLDWIAELGHEIKQPVPSLFTFNMPKHPITELMGIVALDAQVTIQGTKLKASGPLLITHWGMSGPAILKLSSFGARALSECHYSYIAQVNWINKTNHDEVVQSLKDIAADSPKKYLSNVKPYDLPIRLWTYIIEKCDLSPEKPWGDLGKKQFNKIVTTLTNDNYQVNGKTTFKEEFVTCGGVSLADIDTTTMQSRSVPNLYFAGEVMDIDGVTGGYNFQAAWTTAYIAGKLD